MKTSRTLASWSRPTGLVLALAAGALGLSACTTTTDTAPPAAEDPVVTQLRQLAGLRDSGILTEQEFAAKKAQVLGI